MRVACACTLHFFIICTPCTVVIPHFTAGSANCDCLGDCFGDCFGDCLVIVLTAFVTVFSRCLTLGYTCCVDISMYVVHDALLIKTIAQPVERDKVSGSGVNRMFRGLTLICEVG